jgi:RimJ/RimL family protein N-acetyltransferase
VGPRFDVIHTDRLVMRRWCEADREPFAALNADPEVMRYFPASLDRAASDAMVDRIEGLFLRQGFGLWALEVSATGEFIGFTGLNPMPGGVPGAGGMEVGWRLARGAWHQGYASEAAAAAAGVAFRGAGLAELWSMTAVANEPSQAVMRRLGMTRHAHFDHPGVAAGHPLRPHVAYRLPRPGAVALQPGPHVAYRLPRPGAVALQPGPHVAYRLPRPGAVALQPGPHVAYRLPRPGAVALQPGPHVAYRLPHPAPTGHAVDRG